MDYLYDETFHGFLTCVYMHYYEEKATGIYPSSSYQGSMLTRSMEVITDDEKAGRVYDAIETKISTYDMQRIYKVFMSDIPEKENMLLAYIRKGFKEGSRIRLLHGDPVVFAVQQAERKVGGEAHRLQGLIRFSAVQAAGASENGAEILYSKIEPDHDVLEFIAEHFCDRFKSDPFIIHDKRRKKALVAAEGNWYISDFTDEDMLVMTEDEEKYKQLWKQYFNTIAIKERTNPACQKRLMPLRYWKNLTEYEGFCSNVVY